MRAVGCFTKTLTFMSRFIIPLLAAVVAWVGVPSLAVPTDSQNALASFAGEYTAVVDGGTDATSGVVRVVLGKLGRGTLSVRFGRERQSAVQVISDALGAIRFISNPGGNISGELHVVTSGDRSSLFGTVTEDGPTLLLTKASGSVAPRQETFLLGSDAGTGAVRMDGRGRMLGVFQLAGRLPAIFTGHLDDTGMVAVFARLPHGAGSLVGNVDFGGGSIMLHDAAGDRLLSITGARFDPRQPALGDALASVAFYQSSASPRGSILYRPPGAFFGGQLDGTRLALAVTRGWGTVRGIHGGKRLRGVVNQAAQSIAGIDDDGLPFIGILTPMGIPPSNSSSSIGGVIITTTSSSFGTLQISGTNTYQGSSVVSVTNGGTLVFTGSTLTAGSVIVNNASGSARAVSGINGATLESGGVFTGSSTGLVKFGSGTLTFDSSTYSGSTAINSAILSTSIGGLNTGGSSGLILTNPTNLTAGTLMQTVDTLSTNNGTLTTAGSGVLTLLNPITIPVGAVSGGAVSNGTSTGNSGTAVTTGGALIVNPSSLFNGSVLPGGMVGDEMTLGLQ